MKWQPIETAPHDNTPILLKFKPGIELKNFPALNWEIWDSIQFVGRSSPKELSWRFAAPVGFGGISDEWLMGWLPLPAPPEAK